MSRSTYLVFDAGDLYRLTERQWIRYLERVRDAAHGMPDVEGTFLGHATNVSCYSIVDAEAELAAVKNARARRKAISTFRINTKVTL